MTVERSGVHYNMSWKQSNEWMLERDLESNQRILEGSNSQPHHLAGMMRMTALLFP